MKNEWEDVAKSIEGINIEKRIERKIKKWSYQVRIHVRDEKME